ncbi:MAG: nickel pincer cofactor biosynthesis protein LarB [Chloroflexi bacterium]|nr:nickel pincer cofactor biosynthesis protein LarB [Chloroflexota bacterium]
MLRPLSGPPVRLRKREADATIRPALRRRVATDESKLRELLQSFQQGSLSLEEMLEHLRRLPYEDIGFAELDHHRALRRGFPEVILGEGKSEEQVVAIAERLAAASDRLLITRVDVETYGAVKERLPDAHYHADARAITLDRSRERRWPGVVVLCAGTSDLPVAEEAAVTAELMGSQAERYYDVGIAGLHRLLDKLEAIQSARALVVVAGMEGALPSVVAGLVAAPVIAVPTSIGYGASFGGLAPLLAMLNSCAAGVGVVNIDNGFGAGYLAAVINRQSREGLRE